VFGVTRVVTKWGQCDIPHKGPGRGKRPVFVGAEHKPYAGGSSAEAMVGWNGPVRSRRGKKQAKRSVKSGKSALSRDKLEAEKP